MKNSEALSLVAHDQTSTLLLGAFFFFNYSGYVCICSSSYSGAIVQGALPVFLRMEP